MASFDFSAIWKWIIRNATPVTFDNEVDLFEQLFWPYVRNEKAVFESARISKIKSGREQLPKKMVALYNSRGEYASALMDEVENLLSLNFADAGKALAELADIIQSDDSISPTEKRNLLHRAAVDGWDQPVQWVTDMICRSMMFRQQAKTA